MNWVTEICTQANQLAVACPALHTKLPAMNTSCTATWANELQFAAVRDFSGAAYLFGVTLDMWTYCTFKEDLLCFVGYFLFCMLFMFVCV